MALLRMLTDGEWKSTSRSPQHPYTFPRSRLVTAIEEAAEATLEDPNPDDAVLRCLAERSWLPEGQARQSWLSALIRSLNSADQLPGAFLVGLMTAALTAFLTSAGWWIWLSVLLGVPVLYGITRALWQRVPSRNWLRSESRWFTTTTFLTAAGSLTPIGSVLRARISWVVIDSRAQEVARYARAASDENAQDTERQRAKQFLLQLRTLALLEDLRANYRPRTLDMRRRKRTAPPLIFLPRATEDNGGLHLLAAINDIRCRRSEQDPLLLVAGVAHDDWSNLQEAPVPEFGPASAVTSSGNDYYREWIAGLRLGQSSPEERPWIMRKQFETEQLTRRSRRTVAEPQARRTVWALWSPWTALVVVVVLVGAFAWYKTEQHAHETELRHEIEQERCSGHLSDSYLERVSDSDGSLECIGVSTGGSPSPFGLYSSHLDPVSLDGAVGKDPNTGRAGAGINLDWLEHRIEANDEALKTDKQRYVTVVYAGPLTTLNGQSAQALGALQELTGVYLAQVRNNDVASASLRLRVLIANSGQDMRHQVPMVQQIISLAQHDKTIVGVIGLGRDVKESEQSVQLLEEAGIAVIDTTNSSTELGEKYPNYFGLAATDQEETNDIARLIPSGSGRPAMVLTRDPNYAPDDQYSAEQAKYAVQALRSRGYQVGAPMLYQPYPEADFTNVTIQMCGQGTPPPVVYLAGRTDDAPELLNVLRSAPGCQGRPITVLTGDDMTRAQLAAMSIPANVTLYYAALSDPTRLADKSDLLSTARYVPDLHVPGDPAMAFREKMFTNGTLGLGYDAANALFTAANEVSVALFQGSASAAPAVLAALHSVHLTNQATGTIDFSRYVLAASASPQDGGPSRSIALMKISTTNGGRSQDVCNRPAGDPRPMTQWCPAAASVR
ncbi:MAG: amino acid ABC transporter substrate-binding protein [Streptomycetaceae bacterium]|nr:amino acid ABC transporter substrate-binding protein [Streptomycetaceae bacterium]